MEVENVDPSTVQLFMVVCTNFHTCVGPFTNLADAVKAARMWTDRTADQCVYLPVPMVVPGGVAVERPATTVGDGPVLRGGGGYL